MRSELQKKLFNDHPLLYGDRNKPMTQTCMCWGICTGDGWYDLLYEASSKIEKEIEKFIKEHNSDKCYVCGCDVSEHKLVEEGKLSPCKKIHRLPYHFGGWGGGRYTWCWLNIKTHWQGASKSWRRLWYFLYDFMWKKMIWRHVEVYFYRRLNRVSNWLFNKFDIGYNKPCHCKNFELIHPRASQVKEKFGTLRFYMSGATDEIYKIIREVEKRSETTCESCGKPGKLNMEGWWITLCDDCNKIKEEKGGRAPWLE